MFCIQNISTILKSTKDIEAFPLNCREEYFLLDPNTGKVVVVGVEKEGGDGVVISGVWCRRRAEGRAEGNIGRYAEGMVREGRHDNAALSLLTGSR